MMDLNRPWNRCPVVYKDRLAPIAARGNVIHRAREFDTKRACQEDKLHGDRGKWQDLTL